MRQSTSRRGVRRLQRLTLLGDIVVIELTTPYDTSLVNGATRIMMKFEWSRGNRTAGD